MIKRMTIVCLSVLMTAAAAAAEPPTIRDLAPEGTVFIAGISNADASIERLKGTGLWELWQTPQMQELHDGIVEILDMGLHDTMEEIGVEGDHGLPTGSAGIAVFAVMDNEIGLPAPGYLIVADYGPRAEKIMQRIETALEKAGDEMKVEQRDVRGRVVHHLEMAMEEPKPAEDDEFGDMGGFGNMEAPEDTIARALNTVFLVREGNQLMVGNDLAVLSNAIDVCEDNEPTAFRQRDDYAALMEQVGEGDAFALMLTRDLGGLVSVVDPMGFTMMFAPMLKQMVGDIAGFGAGARIAGERAMIEQTFAVSMPNGRTGLTALLDTHVAPGELPAFVGRDVISYSFVNFEFDGLPQAMAPLIQMMQMMIPPGAAGPDGAQVPPMGEMLDQVCSWLGRRVHMVQTLEKPIKADSLRQFIAVECTNTEAFEQFLEFHAPAMGLEGRAFAGQRLYSTERDIFDMLPMPIPGMPGMPGDMASMEPPALGLGGGYLFTGPRSSVEQALRSIGDARGDTLDDDPDFARAMGTLEHGQVVGWGYTNVVEMINGAVRTGELQMQQIRNAVANAEAEAMPGDMDMEDFAHMDLAGSMLGDLLGDVDVDLLRRHLGPATWEMTATDQGFLVKSYMLDATSGR
ncbi:MAG: hypothetical protein GY715_00515, partial [Planctomycetes bacterium]|nr:hypothetical protein [Planctomycetota bacterium]